MAQSKVKTEQLEQLLAQHIGDLESSTQGTAKVKSSVLAATVGTIATAGTQTIDGTSVGIGDRVLVKDQSTASENGIYVVASGSWTRAPDSDTSTRFGSGTQVFVETGTVNGGILWLHTTPSPIVIDTTALTFAQSGAGTSSGIVIQDEGTEILAAATTIDFVGDGVTVTSTGGSPTGNDVTVTISGGGSFRGALAYNSTNLTNISTGFTTPTFNSEHYDTDAIHDTSTNTDRLTVPTGVTKVRVSFRLNISSATIPEWRCFINKNGSGAYIGSNHAYKTNSGFTDDFGSAATAVIPVTSGDYFTIQYQTTSGTYTVLGGSTGSWFMMEIIE